MSQFEVNEKQWGEAIEGDTEILLPVQLSSEIKPSLTRPAANRNSREYSAKTDVNRLRVKG